MKHTTRFMVPEFLVDNKTRLNYTPDVLGDGFEQLVLHFEDDYEGRVVATLVRKKSEAPTTKAILYIHGFNDYFFQREMANRFNQQNYNFYALDLRKYGRSYLNHQKLNNVRSIEEYDAEINEALQIIQLEKNTEVILMGHSTGGLIVTNYAGRHLNSHLFNGVLCNSPFYEFNYSFISRKIGLPILSYLGKHNPNLEIPGGLSPLYGYSIHQDKYGEWDYSLTWKPHKIASVNLGFIHAIHQAQKNVQHQLSIDVPMLVLYSDKSVGGKNWSEQFMEGDSVLNVSHIEKYAHQIKGKITLNQIENGMHDLVLSQKPVRETVYNKIFEWMDHHFK
ncbi:alpha/beta hydrolase [Membranicola marinus]|uniref:Alpha/beta hydrolase n=1 Tax=Membranihabitans marinus TaxID=1227546 RepID=A0A953HXW0_9BACT|nr:alpha/beta hydrolase [Membranihabitans marinus]MBY5959793.1 alpha/beta hydrolase [Membranihabitans marinus]